MAAWLLAVLVSVTGVTLILSKRGVAFVILLALVLMAQNIATMLLLRFAHVSSGEVQLLLMTKEVLLLVGLSSLALYGFARAAIHGRLRIDLVSSLTILWFALVVLHAVASGPPWIVRLAGIRAVVLLPSLFLFGRWLALSWRDASRLLRVIIVIGIGMAGFGLFEAYVLPESFWLSIGHEEFYLQKIDRPIQNTLYGNMRYWFNGQPVRRVASITGDPLISSYPMAMVIVLLVGYYLTRARFRPWQLLAIGALGLATALTLSRGAVLAVAIAVGLNVVAKRSTRLMVALTVVVLLAIMASTAIFGDEILRVTTGAGHVDQLVDGLRRGIERPLGYGLGTASSLATGIARTKSLENLVVGGGDSYMGSIATQMGLPLMVLFYMLMLLMIHDLARHYRRLQIAGRKEAWWFGATTGMLAGLLVTSAVNESGVGFVASGTIFIFAGVLSHLGSLERMRVHHVRVVKAPPTPIGPSSV